MIASKYDAPNRGMTVGQIVSAIIKTTNDLTPDEKNILDRICKKFGTTFRDMEKGIKG